MMVQDQDKSNYALIYMASFWRKTQLVPKKKSLMESSGFGEPTCKLGSKVIRFFVFLVF
jgi:hypothetical protein